MGWFEHRTTIFKTENKQEYSLAAFKPQFIPQSFEAALVAKNGYDLACFNCLQLWYARKTQDGGLFAGITSPGEHSLVEGVKEASDRVLERAMRSWTKVNLQILRRVVWFPEDDAALV